MQGIHVAATGKLGSDSELKYTSNGSAVLSFSLAVAGGKEGEETQWLRVSVWAELAEELHRHGRLVKGAECYVAGKLRLDSWTGSDGQPRTGLSVSAWECVPMGVGKPKQAQHQPSDTRPMGARPQAGQRRGQYGGGCDGKTTRTPQAAYGNTGAATNDLPW